MAASVTPGAALATHSATDFSYARLASRRSIEQVWQTFDRHIGEISWRSLPSRTVSVAKPWPAPRRGGCAPGKQRSRLTARLIRLPPTSRSRGRSETSGLDPAVHTFFHPRAQRVRQKNSPATLHSMGGAQIRSVERPASSPVVLLGGLLTGGSTCLPYSTYSRGSLGP